MSGGQLWQQAVFADPPVYRIKSKSRILNKDFSMHCLYLTPLLIFPLFSLQAIQASVISNVELACSLPIMSSGLVTVPVA